MRKVKGVIFDLDGTLTFFKIDFLAARREVIKKLHTFGIPKDLISINQRIMETIGIVENYFRDVMKESEKIPDIKQKIEDIIIKYEMDGAKKTNLIPGAEELLNTLKRQDYKLGLFTLENRQVTQFILERFSIDTFFNSIITRDDVTNLKPHPDHLREVLLHLGMSSDEIIVVGDNPIDLECAKQINAIAIARLTDRHKKAELLEAGADYIIENLLEIIRIIENINASNIS